MKKTFLFQNMNDAQINLCIPFFESGCDSLKIVKMQVFSSENIPQTIIVSYHENERRTFIPVFDVFQEFKKDKDHDDFLIGYINNFDHGFGKESYISIPVISNSKMRVEFEYKKCHFGRNGQLPREEE